MLSVKKRRGLDIDMTEGNIFRHLLIFSLPLLAGNFFQLLYNTVDTIIVGQYVSDAAFSAVGSLSSTTNLMISFFMGLSSGASVVISKAFGSGDVNKVKRAVSTCLIMTFILAAIMTPVGQLLVEPLLSILDMPADEKVEARKYLVIWLWGISGLMVYNMGAAIMRAVGDSTKPFIMLVFSTVLNAVLDIWFVRGFGMGVEGVAIATIVSQWISAVLVLILLLTTSSVVKIDLKYFKFDKDILKTIVVIGLPMALRLGITSFSNIFVQSYINEFGGAAMGGWTAYSKIDMIVLLPMQSLSIASTTFVGQNLGQNKVKRAERGADIALLMSLVSTAFLIIPIVIFPEFFVSMFNANPDIIEYVSLFLRLLTPFYLVWCVNQIYSGALNGSGNTVVPMIIMLSSFVAFRQVYLYVVANYIDNSPIPISLCYPIGWTIAAIATLIYYKLCGLTPKERIEKEEAGSS